MMSGIRDKDTKPEMIIRRRLHALGYRYRTHVPGLPGKPDIVFPRYRAIVQVQGCFWHHHDCKNFRWPSTRKAFWRAKIEGTERRDNRNLHLLKMDGWRVLIIWECALRDQPTEAIDAVVSRIEGWLESDIEFLSLPNGYEEYSELHIEYIWSTV